MNSAILRCAFAPCRALLLGLSILLSTSAFASEPAHEGPHGHEESTEEHGSKEFDPGHTILHHIADSHEWHFATVGETHIALPLPVILFSSDRGLEIFSSSHFHHGNYQGYFINHDGKLRPEDESRTIWNFSITKNVASLLLSALIMILLFTSIARKYKKRGDAAPKGAQSLFEPLIIFVRDEIAKQNIGHRYARYMPFLLTVFFFIWINNMLGLLPGAANLTGNIAVTLVLSTITLLITVFSGRKAYWKHILATPGVPVPLLIIMVPIEVVGILTKPFALMVRLFANITAGHIIILSLLCLTFIARSVAVGIGATIFASAMTFLELLVAFLQAYIFTLLSAMYIGQAVEDDHH